MNNLNLPNLANIADNINLQNTCLLSYDSSDFIIEPKIQSINKLKVIIEKDQESYPNCCVCLDSFDQILQSKEQKIVLTCCRHLYCFADFQELLVRNNNKAFRCILCLRQIHSYFTLIQRIEDGIQIDHISLRIDTFQRLDLLRFQQQLCKNCGEQGLRALVCCSLCGSNDSAFCVTCIARDSIELIRKNYQKIVFYCGCKFQLNLIQLAIHQPSEIEELHALYKTEGDVYINMLIQKIRQYNRQIVIASNELYCEFCPLKTFKKGHIKKTHVKRCHQDLYFFLYKEACKCNYCQKIFATEQILKKHKCQSLNAPQSFFSQSAPVIAEQ